ncbi:iron/ascorbate-dependent oxidoreductase [Thecamonas trahens ATCC 50062]|uniref:Iron/ascorbate-dependent oxidoreductase n=1 Tax=Thecamonas trahens ATCC 50062 TaxID=461836 RepID=A0A0L0DCU6_THETB|nr:iron/ascorbate-dependent oxidoreductase [Thecamonas trahens ATCC 50062]KNC49133.1 iron/ascorbate-dependent oxidoreductase [Thecamonas trahens ATCC 50062]|eukprot:XP_013758160.1 iron/ascorbate-dependent oxidoreductase [Thecamonas trahens ATCC 50062]
MTDAIPHTLPKPDVVPELDVAALEDAPTAEALAALAHACHTVGFLRVVNHGVPVEVVDDVLAAASEVFSLDQAEKEAVHINGSLSFRGYARVGEEITLGVPDFKETFDVGLEHPPVGQDAVAAAAATGAWAGLLAGANQWPAAAPMLAPRIYAYMDAMRELGLRIMTILAAALDLPLDTFTSVYTRRPAGRPDAAGFALLRLLRYPPQAGAPRIGVGEHSDFGMLTLLATDDIGGLQVEIEPGVWRDVPPRSGTFVLNFGDLLEVWTNGYIRATNHRVISPSSTMPRFSVPFFVEPDLDATFTPLDSSRFAYAPGRRPLDAEAADAAIFQKYEGRFEDALHYGDHIFAACVRSFPTNPVSIAWLAAQREP